MQNSKEWLIDKEPLDFFKSKSLKQKDNDDFILVSQSFKLALG